MKTIHTLAALAMAALLFSACSKDDKTTGGDGRPVQVHFKSTITGQVTRAALTTWDADDQIGVFMKEVGSALSDATILEGVNNYAYKTDGTGAFSPAGTDVAYFPGSNENVSFIAYYPYRGSLTNYIYPVNVATQTAQKNIDLMYSNNITTINETTPTVGLVFQHKLSRMVFNITAGSNLTSADLASLVVTINGIPLTADFSLIDQSLSNLGTATGTSIQALTVADGSSSQAIIVPFTTTGTETVRFAVGGTVNDTYTWTIPASTTFAAGNQYLYNVTVNRTGIDITGTILPWTSGNGAGGENVVAD